jgi:hypothetical protein
VIGPLYYLTLLELVTQAYSDVKILDNDLLRSIVMKELKKKRHSRPKKSFPGGVTMGGADQAFEYWIQYGKFWSNSKKAMELIGTF